MLDIISPQLIDQRKCLIEEKLFEYDPVSAFCIVSILDRIADEWDSGQMSTSRHDDLVLISSLIDEVTCLSADKLSGKVKNIILESKKIKLI